jgi:hypothetical protein
MNRGVLSNQSMPKRAKESEFSVYEPQKSCGGIEGCRGSTDAWFFRREHDAGHNRSLVTIKKRQRVSTLPLEFSHTD